MKDSDQIMPEFEELPQANPDRPIDDRSLAFLNALPILSGIKHESKSYQSFLTKLRMRRYRRGEYVYVQSQNPGAVYLVQDGEIHIERKDPGDNKTVILGVETRGSIFGEVSLLSNRPRTAAAKAALESLIIIIPGQAFLRLMSQEASVGQALALLLSRRLRHRIGSAKDIVRAPARVILVLYPEENPGRSSRLSALLAEEIGTSTKMPTLLCSFSRNSIFHGEEGINLTSILEKWPDLNIAELKKRFHHHEYSFDLIKGDALHRPEQRYEKMAEHIPALLGRLRRQYSTIIVEAGDDRHHPVIDRLISQSDSLALFCAHDRDHRQKKRQELWMEAITRAQRLMKDFEEKLITVSDEIPGMAQQEIKLARGDSTARLSSHIRLRNEINDFNAPASSFDSPEMRRVLARLGRRLTERMQGLCLGGGGARALAHVGVLEVLHDEGIEFDAVSGTSMGAIIGAAYAMGKSPQEINAMLKEILPDSSSILDKTLPLVSFFRGRKLSRVINHTFGNILFEDLDLPFYCNASDLNTGQTVFFEKGYLATALRASASLPGIFPPLVLGRRQFVDGAVLNNLPGAILREKGCHTLLGINVSPFSELGADSTEVSARGGFLEGVRRYITLPPILKIVYRAINIEGWELMKHRMTDFNCVIHPETGSYDLFDFDLRDEIVEKGRIAARNSMEDIKKALEGATELPMEA